MGYRLLLDENVEREVLHRLEERGHDVVHVDLVEALGKGVTDEALARFSREEDRAIVTYDDDFVAGVPASEYRATLSFEDDTLSAGEIAEIIHLMAQAYPYDEVEGLQKTGREWL